MAVSSWWQLIFFISPYLVFNFLRNSFAQRNCFWKESVLTSRCIFLSANHMVKHSLNSSTGVWLNLCARAIPGRYTAASYWYFWVWYKLNWWGSSCCLEGLGDSSTDCCNHFWAELPYSMPGRTGGLIGMPGDPIWSHQQDWSFSVFPHGPDEFV